MEKLALMNEQFIPQLIEMHQKGHFPIEKLCRTYPAEKLEEAIHDMHTGKVSRSYFSRNSSVFGD